MKEKINAYLEEINSFKAATQEQVEEFRIKFLSKKGLVPGLFSEMKNIPPEARKEMGQVLNQLKNKAQEKVTELKNAFDNKDDKGASTSDLTLPANFIELGSRHPITIVRNEIINIFSRIGFTVSEGPEIESDWYNFTALNFPEEHPARDMQDTFFIEKDPDILLRTHTSSVQIRVMEKEQPPIRAIFPGRVFRNEAISARAHCIFHQIEGLYIDENVSFADLKQTLYYFATELYGCRYQNQVQAIIFPFY